MTAIKAEGLAAGKKQNGLRGHIDAIRVANSFIEVIGWVCREDGKAAEAPLQIEINKQVFAGYNLRYRADLESAGIADGIAAFDAVIKIIDCSLASKFEIVIKDSTDLTCTVQARPWQVSRFTPRGMIDEIGSHFVIGWVFDPTNLNHVKTFQLLLDSEIIAAFSATIDRPDLLFDMGDGAHRFGFEIPLSDIREVLLSRGRRFCNRFGELALASSDLVLSRIRVDITDGTLTPAGLPRAISKRERLIRSDLLTRLMSDSLPG